MRVRIDQGADAIYLNLSDRAVSESEEVADGIVVDYDTDGRVVGIEILDASKRAGSPETLMNYSFELPGVAWTGHASEQGKPVESPAFFGTATT